MICEALVILGDPHHHLPRFRIRELVGDAARFLGALELSRMEPYTVICMARGPQTGGTIPSRAALHNTWTADMPTSKECRQHAEECLRLANETTQIYARQALLELAAEFREIAEQLETRAAARAEAPGVRPAPTPPARRRRAC